MARDKGGDPNLLLLGPVLLTNMHGDLPPRSTRQCEEYCGWLLRYPGQTAPAMCRSLVMADGTRRSNVSRLRSWLGTNDEGEQYLPEARSGRLRLHPDVTSDWEQTQLLVTGDARRASELALHQALELVRGAPIADAAPGQWHWAEDWRCEMAAAVRDIGVALANLALARRDIDLARWAAARALLASPQDDQLMMVRLRTEHLAGNQPEVNRLAFEVMRRSKVLGFELSEEMADVVQEAITGVPRLRFDDDK